MFCKTLENQFGLLLGTFELQPENAIEKRPSKEIKRKNAETESQSAGNWEGVHKHKQDCSYQGEALNVPTAF